MRLSHFFLEFPEEIKGGRRREKKKERRQSYLCNILIRLLHACFQKSFGKEEGRERKRSLMHLLFVSVTG